MSWISTVPATKSLDCAASNQIPFEVVHGTSSNIVIFCNVPFKLFANMSPPNLRFPFTERSPIITKLPSIGAIRLNDASGTISRVLIETSL